MGDNITIVTRWLPGEYYTFKYIAKKIPIDDSALRRLRSQGAIPPHQFQSTMNVPLYTPAQMEALIHGYRRLRTEHWSLEKFKSYLESHWHEEAPQ